MVFDEYNEWVAAFKDPERKKKVLKRVIVFNEAMYGGDIKAAYRTLARLLKEYPAIVFQGTIPENQGCAMVFRELGDLRN
jgi:hypothetical protein